MAIELGANLLGEVIIFVIGAGVLLLEYQRQARKETMKDEMAIQERLELHATLNELAFQAERQDTQIRELARILADLGEWFCNLCLLQWSQLLFILDSKSWTPKILTDIVGRKKIKSECSEEDNPLELLPEKRSKIPLKDKNLNKTSASESGNNKHHTLIHAIDYLLTDVFYSNHKPEPIEKMKGGSILANSLNYLFVDAGDNVC